MDPADDVLQTGDQTGQPAPGAAKIIRRVEITVEREITTVILRRKNEPSNLNPSAKPHED